MPTSDITRLYLYADVDRRLLVSADGVPLAGEELLTLYREEIVILCLTCVDSDGAAVGFHASNTYELGVAEDYDQTTTVLCLSEDDQFNIAGDWADADAEDGKLSVRLNTYTDEFEDHLDTNRIQFDTRLYLRRFGASTASIVFDYPCLIHNIARASASIPAGITEPTYRTAADQDVIDAGYALIVETRDIEITDATKGWIFRNAAGERRRLTVDNMGRVCVSDPIV
ncbi:MAG: hypothetical protein WC372_12300 [Candidatus Neomarinimicrobiota bacterium]|jgi:hypothetical protein